MIKTLQDYLPNILQRVREALVHPNLWDSLVINRRKPHTYRVFQQIGDYRVCLHRFEPCEEADAFPHPHPWPGAFLLLEGEYVHTVGGSADLHSDPEYYIREIVRPYSMYEIINPLTWHMVQPLKTTYTVMINGAPWKTTHDKTRTTKGKALESMSEALLLEHLAKFEVLLMGWEDYGESDPGME